MNVSKLAPAALSIGLLGIVGGVAAVHAFEPVSKPAVHLVQPAAQVVTSTATVTVTPTATATTTAPKPAATTTTAKPAPVQSTQAPAPAPVIKKAAVVSSDTSTSSPAPAPDPTPSNTGKVITNPDGSTTIQMQPGQQPPVLPAHTPPPAPSN